MERAIIISLIIITSSMAILSTSIFVNHVNAAASYQCNGNPHDDDSGPTGNPHDADENGNPHDNSAHGLQSEHDGCRGSK